MKFIKNSSGTTKTWVGVEIPNSEYYAIESVELSSFSNNADVLTAILNGEAVMSPDNSGSSDIINPVDGMEFLRDEGIKNVTIASQPSFTNKQVDGKSLFSRAHGVKYTLTSGLNVIEFITPYQQVKFNEVEILEGEAGDTVSLKILDTASGTYTTIPNHQLNQFGFDLNVAKSYYKRKSSYDADLYIGLRIVLEYNSVSAKDIYVNYTLHELK